MEKSKKKAAASQTGPPFNSERNCQLAQLKLLNRNLIDEPSPTRASPSQEAGTLTPIAFGSSCRETHYGAIIVTKSEEEQALLRLPTKMLSAFDRIATVLGRDRNWVMQKALSRYLATEGVEILQDAEGLDELDNGESVDLKDVLKKARTIVDSAQYRRGRP